LQWIPLDQLQAHPENSNRMQPHLLEKLKRHIQRTGLYEPLVVRPINCGLRNADCELKENDTGPPATAEPHANPQFAIRNPQSLYQILNGHHRAEALRQLGHTHARCDVWNVSDADALMLLATLNRLEGRDDPAARARLVAKLAGDRSPEDLARLLPEPADAVARLLALATPPPEPLAPPAAAPAARPMTFFLTEEQHTLVREALAEAAREPSSAPGESTKPYSAPGEHTTPYLAPGEYTGGEAAKSAPTPCHPPCIHGGLNTQPPHEGLNKACSRAETLERIALWYLEARNLR
ncbi:MAG: ParB N-terminal domain-containing protein, partial [Planctomycetota bacterium]|nr:ParB N-terminal domain-containing protein [Planctomycetota bacterium]